MLEIKKELVKFDKLLSFLLNRRLIINAYSSLNNDPGKLLNLNVLTFLHGEYKDFVKAKVISDELRYDKNPNIKLYFEAIQSNKFKVQIKKQFNFKTNLIIVTFFHTSSFELYCVMPVIKEIVMKYKKPYKRKVVS